MAGIQIRIVSGAEVSLVWAMEASDEQLALATSTRAAPTC